VAKGAIPDKAGKAKVAEKKVFSPVRDPLGNSTGAGDISSTLPIYHYYMVTVVDFDSAMNSAGREFGLTKKEFWSFKQWTRQ
jgi:hypothetical protein